MARRRYGRKGQKTGKVTKATKTYVKKVLDARIEDKMLSLCYTPGAVSNFPAIITNDVGTSAYHFALNGMVRGTSNGQRIGNKIRMKWCRFKAQIFGIAGDVARVRFTLIYKNQLHNDDNFGAGILPVNFYQNGTVGNQVVSPIDTLMKDQINILKDRVYQMSPGGDLLPPQVFIDTGKIRLNKTAVFTNSSTGTVADFIKGAISGYLIGDNLNWTTINAYSFEMAYEDA